MAYLPDIIGLLESAESQLQGLGRKALAEGAYSEVARIAETAKSVKSIRLSLLASSANRGATPSVRDSLNEGDVLVKNRSRSSQLTSSSDAAAKSTEYPMFRRQGRRLVKVGWSSKEKRVYEHRAPLDAVEEICGKFLEKAGTKGELRIDKIIPMKLANGEELPSYQIYLVLKWLQQLGVVERQGKDGYLLADPDFNVKQLWASTPAT